MLQKCLALYNLDRYIIIYIYIQLCITPCIFTVHIFDIKTDKTVKVFHELKERNVMLQKSTLTISINVWNAFV